MAQVLAGSEISVSGRVFSRPYSLLGVVFLFILAVPSFLHKSQDWESVYIPAAVHLSYGEDVFQGDFVYPPINAWLPLPWVGLPRLPARALWYAINMTALTVLLFGAWKLSGGGRLEGTPSIPWREHAIFWLGLGCGISSCLDTITNQQTDLIVAALVIMGCIALTEQRDLRAGLWFGVAAALKCTPLLWAGYLAWRKQWAAALLVPVVAIGINLIPDLTHAPPTSETRLGQWAGRFLLPMADRKHDFGTWNCGIGGNQSVAGLGHRWLVYDTIWKGNHLMGTPSADRVAPETLKAATWGFMLLLLGVGLACTWKTSARSDTAPPARGVQFGMVLILMVLLSPHSSKPHYCTLLLPGFCVARAALTWPSRGLLVVLLAALGCALVSNCDLVGTWVYSWAKWYGSLAWCAVLLYAGSCWVLMAAGESISADRQRK